MCTPAPPRELRFSRYALTALLMTHDLTGHSPRGAEAIYNAAARQCRTRDQLPGWRQHTMQPHDVEGRTGGRQQLPNQQQSPHGIPAMRLRCKPGCTHAASVPADPVCHISGRRTHPAIICNPHLVNPPNWTTRQAATNPITVPPRPIAFYRLTNPEPNKIQPELEHHALRSHITALIAFLDSQFSISLRSRQRFPSGTSKEIPARRMAATDFTFQVFDLATAAAAGRHVRTTCHLTDGLFTVTLDFGVSPFTAGVPRGWKSTVRTNALAHSAR